MRARSKAGSPLVSVIVPAYNAEAFIAQTLESALAQTYTNIELLVVDDGSQDRTAVLVESIAIQDSRVKLLRSSNQGVAAARNLAIENARGEYIAPLDADDIWYPEKLEKQVDCLSREDAGVGLVYAWSVYIDERGRLTGGCIASEVEGNAYLPLVYSNFVGNASAPLIRRKCLEWVGGYSTWYRQQSAQGSEDRELYMRLAEFYRFRLIPEFLVGYRQVSNSMSCHGPSMARAHELLLSEVRKRYPEIPRHVFRWSRSRSNWYLAQKFSRCGEHGRALSLLYRTACLDPVILANRQLYMLALRGLAGRIGYPLSGRYSNRKQIALQSSTGSLTVADIRRRRKRRSRLWQRVNAKRMQTLSELRFSGIPENGAAALSGICSRQQSGEPS